MEDFLTEEVDIERLVDTTGNKRAYQNVITALPVTIQPLDDSISQDIDGGFGKDWLMMAAYSDIKEGDRVVRAMKRYRVVGVEKHTFMGHQHTEARIRIFES